MSHLSPSASTSARLPGLVVRSADPADAHAIAQIDAAARGLDIDTIRPLIAGELGMILRGELPRYTCVAERDGALLGYGRCGWFRWSERGFPHLPEGWYLNGVTVDPGWRRRGVGSALTRHRLAWLRERTDGVRYFTGADNAASEALHAGFGFAPEARDLEVPTGPGRSGPGGLFALRWG